MRNDDQFLEIHLNAVVSYFNSLTLSPQFSLPYFLRLYWRHGGMPRQLPQHWDSQEQ